MDWAFPPNLGYINLRCDLELRLTTIWQMSAVVALDLSEAFGIVKKGPWLIDSESYFNY